MFKIFTVKLSVPLSLTIISNHLASNSCKSKSFFFKQKIETNNTHIICNLGLGDPNINFISNFVGVEQNKANLHCTVFHFALTHSKYARVRTPYTRLRTSEAPKRFSFFCIQNKTKGLGILQSVYL